MEDAREECICWKHSHQEAEERETVPSVLKTTSERPQSGPVTPLSSNKWLSSNRSKQGGTAIRISSLSVRYGREGFFMHKKHVQMIEIPYRYPFMHKKHVQIIETPYRYPSMHKKHVQIKERRNDIWTQRRRKSCYWRWPVFLRAW